jgi:hypothetical protein
MSVKSPIMAGARDPTDPAKKKYPIKRFRVMGLKLLIRTHNFSPPRKTKRRLKAIMAIVGATRGDTATCLNILKSTDLKIHTIRAMLTEKRKMNHKIFFPVEADR